MSEENDTLINKKEIKNTMTSTKEAIHEIYSAAIEEKRSLYDVLNENYYDLEITLAWGKCSTTEQIYLFSSYFEPENAMRFFKSYLYDTYTSLDFEIEFQHKRIGELKLKLIKNPFNNEKMTELQQKIALKYLKSDLNVSYSSNN